MKKSEVNNRYQVIIIETVSAHSTREAAHRALVKLPSRKSGALALVIETPAVIQEVKATKKGKKS